MELTTDRLRLREFVEEDVSSFLAYHADPRAQAFYGPDDIELRHLRTLVPLFMRWATDNPRQNWQLAIVARSTPVTLIGSAGLRQAGEPQGVAQFGIELAPESWRQGFATEAARALFTFGFSSRSLEAIRGVTVSANTRVSALLRRLGFRQVGEQEGPGWLSARGWREVTWELTREQWKTAEGSSLQS